MPDQPRDAHGHFTTTAHDYAETNVSTLKAGDHVTNINGTDTKWIVTRATSQMGPAVLKKMRD